MAKKKFKATPFKKWLDELARVIVKTRDGWTCQINQPGCAGGMVPGDENCDWHHVVKRSTCGLTLYWDLENSLTACRSCHSWAEANQVDCEIWFANKYPYRWDDVQDLKQIKARAWHQSEYEAVELNLLIKAVDYDVDYLHIKPEYRTSFKGKIEEILCES